MRLKWFCTVNAICALFAGAILYLLFRPNIVFLYWLHNSAQLSQFSFTGDTVVRYFFPDYLWCYALCFSLFRLHLPATGKAVLISISAFVFGTVWEIMQWVNCVPGTGDILDCVAYGAGALTALCIYLLNKRRKL